MDRRSFLKSLGAATLLPVMPRAFGEGIKKIDRKALVDRHKIVLKQPEKLSSLTVGNGEFGFTADITGLQTFPEFHANGIQLQTMAQWGWHTTPSAQPYKLADTFNLYDAGGKKVPYPSGDENGGGFGDGSPAAYWLNANPHKFDLGRIALQLPEVDGRPAKMENLTDVHQELDLWTGLLTSRFRFQGQSVVVETVVHPTLDVLAVRITSPLRLGIRLLFPYAPADWRNPADWNRPDAHTTALTVKDGECRFSREIDKTTSYSARTTVGKSAEPQSKGPHEFAWNADGVSPLSAVFEFAPKQTSAKLPTFDQVRNATANHWKKFWSTGGVIDLSESTDPRWRELERRIVLSQYLTAINCSGSLPPQETGLVQNSWFGKFHLEMHWWHAAHFPLWGRSEMLMRCMDYYRRILPVARDRRANRV